MIAKNSNSLAGRGLGTAILPQAPATAHSAQLHALTITRPRSRLELAWESPRTQPSRHRPDCPHPRRSATDSNRQRLIDAAARPPVIVPHTARPAPLTCRAEGHRRGGIARVGASESRLCVREGAGVRYRRGPSTIRDHDT